MSRGGAERHNKFRGFGRNREGKLVTRHQVFDSDASLSVVQKLVETDPDAAKELLAHIATGKTSGLKYNLFKAAIDIDNVSITCDGCKNKFPLKDTDFTDWTKGGSDDLCARCSSE